MENTNKVERNELWNDIYRIVNQIPRKEVDGDAVDASSATTSIEQLISSYKIKTEKWDKLSEKIAKCYVDENNMALIRQIKRNSGSGMYAYVEFSDEDKSFTILGGKEFHTYEEAEDYSKGFEIDSYDYVKPLELKIKRLTSEKEKLEKRLSEIDNELNSL